MIFRQIQMPMVPVWFLIISSLGSFNKMYGDAIDVTHFCYEVTGQPTQVRLVVNILVKTVDSFAKVYAFDASSGDTTQSANRIADAACIKDDTGISDTVPITYDMTITTTDASHSCGIQVAAEGSDTVVKFVFRIYTNSETVNHPDDVTYEATCKMSDLTGIEIPTAQLETTDRANTVSQRQADGAFLTLVDDENKVVNIARVGDKVRLQAEYYPNLQKGPDNCGDDFYVGFLGIDPLSGVSASELYVIITPKYNLDTDVVVTTKHGTATYNFVDGNSQKIVFPSDLMGCSDGGVAEIEDKGVHIQALSQVREICVVVCSKETGLGDCYDALPNDVLGTDYIAASMPAADESSEFMIISHADDNEVTVDIPGGYSHIIELSGQTTTVAGGTITFTLNQRQAFHLAQTSATASMSNVNGYHITSTKQVSVISGNRLYGSNHAVTQLPPTTKAGEKYVLIPVDINTDGRLTTYIIQPVEAGDTEVIRYLTETTSDSYTVPYGEYLALEVDTTPFEITSDKPISVVQIVNGPINSGTAGSSMTWIPPVNRWSSVYTISHPEYVISSLTVFKSQEDADAYRVKVGDGNPIAITPPRVDVAGPSGYIFGTPSTLQPGKITFHLDGVVSTFYVMGFLKDDTVSNSGSIINGAGIKLSDFGECVKHGRRADLYDNDCDGEVDEELLDSIDNDGDGLVDEDVRAFLVEYSGAVAISPKNCFVSPESGFPDNNRVQITGVDGCAVSGSIFAMAGEFTPFDSDKTGSDIQPKILRSGLFSVAQYVDHPMLFFKCDIAKYCISASDTDCTTAICDGGRKRRQVNSENSVDNITTSTWVFPYDISPSKPTITETVQDPSSFKTCLDNTYVQISYILLLILMLISFFTALCFCCLFKRNSRREKEIDKNFYKQRTRPTF